jgi:hypothetical protein
MKIDIIIIIGFLSFFNEAFTDGIFYHKYSEFAVNNVQVSYRSHSNVQSHLMCLSYCNRESNCQTVNFNKETKACSLYDSRIDTNNLVYQSSSAVFVIKGNPILRKRISRKNSSE